MKKLWFILSVVGVYLILSMKLYADTVRSQFPLWVTSCDGYTQGIAPWGCNVGEVRFLGADDEVHGYYLSFTPISEVVPDPVSPFVPSFQAPVVIPETVTAMVAPEPNYIYVLFLVLLFVAFWREGIRKP